MTAIAPLTDTRTRPGRSSRAREWLQESRIPQGEASRVIQLALSEIIRHDQLTISGQDPFRARFLTLAAQWRATAPPSSSARELAMHPAYQGIIGMGERAVPFLLEELQHRPDHWFWALRAITGCDPVPRSHWGSLAQMSHDWIMWGRRAGWIR